jgi:hypothetical protein
MRDAMPLDLHVLRSHLTLRVAALGFKLGIKLLAKVMFRVQLRLQLGGLLLRETQLLLHLRLARLEGAQALRLLVGRRAQGLVVELQDLERFSRLGQIAIEASDRGVRLLRLLAQTLYLFIGGPCPVRLGGELSFELAGALLMLLESGVQARRSALMIASGLRGVLMVAIENGKCIGQLFVRDLELAQLAVKLGGGLPLPVQRFRGLEEPGLYTRIIVDQGHQGVGDERAEDVLQPADLLETFEHLADPDAQHLRLPPGGVQHIRAVRRLRRCLRTGVVICVYVATVSFPWILLRRRGTHVHNARRIIHDAPTR